MASEKNAELKKNKVKKAYKKKKKLKKLRKFKLGILDVLLIIVFTAGLSCLMTGIIVNKQYKNKYSELKNTVYDENVSNFINIYNNIKDNYYETVDGKELVDSAIDGMLKHLEDTYSIYLKEEDSSQMTEMLDGTYEGIGIFLSENEVIFVYKDSPADIAGIKIGDKLLKINEVEINKDNYDNISDLLNEEVNKVEVERKNKKITFEVSKDIVVLPSVQSKVINKDKKNIGYIEVSNFSSNSHEQFVEALIELEKKNIDSLIIDLRGNNGGYLNMAYNIASLFLKKGSIVYSLEAKEKVTNYEDKDNEERNYKVIILVDNETASAGEVLTAALKDSYGAKIVGEKTYGKGKVQTILPYGESLIKYTSSKWLRPNGECIDGIGIEPDYKVSNVVKGNTIYDKQLDKAIALLVK